MKYNSFCNETYNLYTIETNKFKSSHMEVVFRSKATKKNITYTALLCDILMESCKNYPSRKLLARELARLYNASFNSSTSRVGETLITNFTVDFLDPKYTSMDVVEETIKLLFELLFEPNINEDGFDEKTFERLKKSLAIEIDALKEDPKQASILEGFQEIDKEDLRSFNASGDAFVLDEITPKKLYDFYLNFLENSARDVYVIGNLNMKQIDKFVKKYQSFTSITTTDIPIFLDEIKSKGNKTSVKDGEITQTQLVQIYSLHGLTEKEENYVLPLFNMLWGSGSLESKLYKALRGENSLCYNVNTFYQKYDRVVVLHTAIDEASTNLALKLIGNTLADMRKGFIEEDELENVKNQLVTSLHLALDNPNRLIDLYVFKNIANLEDIETRVDEIRKVTVSDLLEVAKKIKLQLTYRVRGN